MSVHFAKYVSDEIIKNVIAVQLWRSEEDMPEIVSVLLAVISVLYDFFSRYREDILILWTDSFT